jgi:hypothetical protein
MPYFHWNQFYYSKSNTVKKQNIDHFKNRSAFTEHTIQNNKDLTQAFGGRFITASYIQGY